MNTSTEKIMLVSGAATGPVANAELAPKTPPTVTNLTPAASQTATIPPSRIRSRKGALG